VVELETSEKFVDLRWNDPDSICDFCSAYLVVQT